MGRIYKENKNFVNKYISYLNAQKDKEDIKVSPVLVLNNSGKRIPITFELKCNGNIEIEETGRNLFFCIKLKELDRYFYNKDYKNLDVENLSYEVFMRDISRWAGDSVLSPIRDYLASTVKKASNGESYSSMSNGDLVYIIKNQGFDKQQLRNYPGIKEVEKAISSILSADIDIELHKEVFKSLKNRELFPVSYISDDKNSIYVPVTTSSSRKSMQIYDSTRLDVIASASGNEMKKDARLSFSYTPFSQWVVIDIKSDTINKNAYMGYNYDL